MGYRGVAHASALTYCRYMSAPDPASNHPLVSGPGDPEHDPAASWALEPEHTARLLARVVSTTGETVLTSSPINRQPLAHVSQSSPADVAAAYATARRAQERWARTPVEERAAMMLRLHDLVLERQDEIIDVVMWESAKSRLDAYSEVLHVALTCRYYGRRGPDQLASQRRSGAFPGLTRIDVHRAPKGVVGIISPWNYPFTMALCDGLPALLAGNAVVAKPDAQTMLSALLGAELIAEAGFPEGLWNVVAGPGPEVGGALMEHADYVCFTGSTATGRVVAHACAERLIGCSLELGGKNPILVLRDAHLGRAAAGAVRATYSNAGQLCVSTERMYVADQVYDAFVDAFVSRTQALSLGAGLGWEHEMGSLISQDQLDTVTAHVEDAVAKGATVLTGGRARPDLAPFFYEPTVLEGVTPDMTCFGKETFGPVVSLYRFHDEADAVARANAGEYGLNGSVWSRDGRRAREVARQLRCGTVNVNEAFAATFASLDAPMGGVRQSGLGRRQGPEGITRFADVQSVGSQRLLPVGPSLGLDAEHWAAMMNLSSTVLHKLGRA